MNHFLKTIAWVAISLFGVIGCNQRLEITPVQSIDQGTALSTPDGVKATLVGAYSTMNASEAVGVFGQSYVYADLLASTNELRWSGTYQGLTQMVNKQMTIDNVFVTNLWMSGYKVINQANSVLASLNVLATADRNRVEGEAKFIRGSVLFELVKLYARDYGDGDPNVNPGVPIVLTPTTTITDSSYVARSTVAQTYAQILSDLTDAERLLPAANGAFATQGAAAAMLSRVYLMQRNYAPAASAANRVISSGKYQLVTPVANEYPGRVQQPVGNTPEDIFALQINTQSGFNVPNEYYGSTNYGGRGDVQVDSSLIRQFSATDERRKLFFDDAGSTRTLKYQNQYANVPVLRLAEMYLTRAEANFRAGTSTGAAPLADVNTVRARAGAPALTPAALTLDAILTERYKELIFEGQLLHDYRRTGRNVGSLAWTSPRLIFPIPQREMQSNPKLVQNTGY